MGSPRLSATAAERDDAKVWDFTVLGDHLHFLVDAANNKALTSVVCRVAIRIAKQINKLSGRKGVTWPTSTGWLFSKQAAN